MASFDITAQINLRGPTNVKKIAADIRRQLGSVKANVNLKLDPKTVNNVSNINKNFRDLNKTLVQSRGNINAVTKAFGDLNRQMQALGNTSKTANTNIKQVASSTKQAVQSTQQLTKAAKDSASGMQKLGEEFAVSARKFAVFNTVNTVIRGVTSAISEGISSFVEYERELAKVQQVTGSTDQALQSLSKGILQASVATGAAASELAKVSVVLSQAGLTAKETSEALDTLAKTTLAPTFGEITDTTEGAIAILRQFKLETSDLEQALGSINAVAGAFAVSASDIIVAVKQAGAVFASSSQGVSQGTDALNEFIAVFTSVRQTTRESAETIGTGLKTIITRLQRLDTIEALKNFGIELTNLEGKFVGPFEAIKRLNEGLASFDPRDVRFGAIIEELGGFRQVGKVIPLIQQFQVAQEALNVAREGGNSITDQEVIAQRTLAVQIQKTSANFQELITNVANSEAFQNITKGVLTFTNAVIDLIDALKDVLPVLAAIAAQAAIPSLVGFAKGFGAKILGKNQGGPIPFARGGYVPGQGNRDTVPAMLTPGEFVIRKKAVEAIGVDKLGAMNNGASPIATQAKANGGMIQYFAKGGKVSVDYANKKPSPSEERKLIGNNIVESVNALAGYYDPSAKQYNSRKSPKNIANYSGIVGGVFESAVELVAGNSDKQKNNDVWDYPTGLGDTTLFNNVPGLGVPTDAKKSASTATVRKKLKAHYRNAKGTDLNRTQFGIVAFGKGEDYEYSFDVDQIKSEVAGQRAGAAKAQGRNRGGLIQFFEDGGTVLPMTGTGKVTQKNLANASIADLEATLKSPKLSPAGRVSVQAALDKAQTSANAPDVAVVGILPLGYKKDYPVAKFGPAQAKLHARGLPETKASIIKEISGGLQGLVGNVAQKLAGRSQLLTAAQEKATGLENVQGTVFEAVLSSLGAVGGTVQNQALDYRNGLGPAASLYPGIGADWPTEVKRDVTGSGLTRAKGEFARYFTEMAQGKNLGGMIQKFAEGGAAGDTVPAMLTPGEFVINKKAAKKIGLSRLRQMNYADKVKGYNKGGAVGGVQYFQNGGGPSATNPFANMGGALGNQAAKTQAQAAKTQQQAANQQSKAAQSQQDAADEMSVGQQVFFAFIGPAIEQALVRAFPNDPTVAGIGEGIQQGLAANQTTSGITSALGKAITGLGPKFAKLGQFVTKAAGPLGKIAGIAAGIIGFNTGRLRKSVELLAKDVEFGAKETNEAFKKFGDILIDPETSAIRLARALDEASTSLQTTNADRQALAAGEKRQLQPYLPFLESDEDKEFRQARERQIDDNTFKEPADAALKQLEAAIQSGRSLGDVFDEMKDGGLELKRTIGLSNRKFREQILSLEEQIAEAKPGSQLQKDLNLQYKRLVDSAYVETAARLEATARLKAGERAQEANRRRLVQATTSLDRYIQAFGTSIALTAADLKTAGNEAKSWAEGFAGTSPENLFAENIKRLENPTAFSEAENATAIDPLRGVLGENALVFQELNQLPKRLEAAITGAATANAGKDSETVGRAIAASIEDSLGAFSGTTLGNALAGSIREEINKATKGAADGQVDTQKIIDDASNIVKKIGETFRKAAIEALKLVQQAFSGVVKFAQNAEIALNKYNTALLASAQVQRAFIGDIQRLVSGRNDPRSVREIRSRTTSAARNEVDGVAAFIQTNADLQRQLVALQTEENSISKDNSQALAENAAEQGRVRGQIQNLRSATENLRSALTNKLNELKSELSNRLAQLKEQQQASQNVLDLLFTDEAGTNERFDAAFKLSQGDASGISSGPEALKVLKDIAFFQKSGLINDDPAVLERAYRNALKATGINLNARGEKIFRQAFQQPEEDQQVQQYVNELKNTNAEILNLTNALNFNELTNTNNALIASQNALVDAINNLPETTKRIAGELLQQGLKSPIEVAQAGQVKIEGVDELNVNQVLGAPNAPPPVNKARGGVIYRSRGGDTSSGINFQPRGTDTVPAMLTPGEFVVNAKATAANRGLLESINSSTGPSAATASYSRGGVIYRRGGGATRNRTRRNEEERKKKESESSFFDYFPIDSFQDFWLSEQALNSGRLFDIYNNATVSWNKVPFSATIDRIGNLAPGLYQGFQDVFSGLYSGGKSLLGFKNSKGFPLWVDDYLKANPLASPSDLAQFSGKGPNFWQKIGARILPKGGKIPLPTLKNIGGWIGKTAQSSSWAKTAAKWAGSANIAKLASLGKATTTLGASKFDRGVALTTGLIGLAEWVTAGGIAANKRYSELAERNDVGLLQLIASPLGEFLAGGIAQPIPEGQKFATKDGKIVGKDIFSAQSVTNTLRQGSYNILRTFNGMNTAYDLAYAATGNPITAGFAAAGGGIAVITGQGIRLIEEAIGLYSDRKELKRSRAQTDRQDTVGRSGANSRLFGGTVPQALDDQLDKIGLLQYNRAQRKGRFLGEREWYNQKALGGERKFDLDIADAVAPADAETLFNAAEGAFFRDTAQKYWNGKAVGTIASIDEAILQYMKPLAQLDSTTSGASKGDIATAYEEVARYWAEAQKQQLDTYGGLPVGVYPNSSSLQPRTAGTELDTFIESLRNKQSAILDQTAGKVNPESGEREAITASTTDDAIRSLQNEEAKIYGDAAEYYKGYPSQKDDTGRTDILGIEDTQAYGKQLVALFEKIQGRKSEIIREQRKREEVKRDEERRKKLDRINANEAAAEQAALVSSIQTGDIPFMEDYPYVDMRRKIFDMQTDSVKFRQAMNDADADGPKFGSYLDFVTGSLGPEANLLLKNQASIDQVTILGKGIEAYRNAYRQSSPLYATATSKFGDALDNWADEPGKKFLKNAMVKGGEIDPAVLESITGQQTIQDPTEEEIWKQMGYPDAATYRGDKEGIASQGKESEAYKNFVFQEKAAIAEVKNKKRQELLNNLTADQRLERELVQVTTQAYSQLAGTIKGINFYRTDPAAGGLNSVPDVQGAQAAALSEMVPLIGDQAFGYMVPGEQLSRVQERGVLDEKAMGIFYARFFAQAQNISKNATPEEKKARAEQLAKEEAANKAEAQRNQNRYRKVVQFGRSLQGKPIPYEPLAWLNYRDEQSKKFAGIANDTQTTPTYPDAKDIPALTEAGISQKWVNNLFDRAGGLADIVSPEGARELLRWKATQQGQDPERLIALSQKVDGRVGLNDIYPTDIAGDGDTGRAAATDLSNIWKETQRFGNVLTRDRLALPLLEQNLERLNKAGLWNPARGLAGNVNAIGALDPRLDKNDIQKKLKQYEGKTLYYNEGGAVFTPRGTDTVPAMLTPGEYVVNRKAAAANRPLLDAINGGRGNQSRRKGYYNDGGDVNGNGVNNITLDTSEISKFITSFDRFSKELAALNVPEQITIQGTHTVEVNVNGAQVLNDLLTGPLGDLVRTEIAGAFELQNQDSEGTIPNPFNPATNT